MAAKKQDSRRMSIRELVYALQARGPRGRDRSYYQLVLISNSGVLHLTGDMTRRESESATEIQRFSALDSAHSTYREDCATAFLQKASDVLVSAVRHLSPEPVLYACP